MTGGEGVYRLPASFGQERLWVLEHLVPGQSLYTHSWVGHITGRLDVQALRRAIALVVERHETLRTGLEHSGGRLTQVVLREAMLETPVIDLGHMPAGDGLTAAKQLAEGLSREPFDLGRPPLFRTTIIRISDESHVLVLAMHHSVSDGWSMGVLTAEISEHYDALVSGRAPQVADLAVQYGDYAAWQRDRLKGPEVEGQLAWWRETLDGAPSLLALPTDRGRPAVQTFKGDEVEIRIDDATGRSLDELARTHDVTPFMLLLAAFDVLLWRYTGETDIVLATPVAGRTRSELERLMGFFVNTLLIRVDVTGDPSFLSFLRRVRDAALGAYVHQELPFEKLVEKLSPPRELAHLPLAQVMFILQTAGSGELSLRDLRVEPVPLPVRDAPFDLTLELFPDGDGLRGSMIFNTDLFDRATIEQMKEHFTGLLCAIVRDPGRPLSALEYMSSTEKRHLLGGWYRDVPGYLTEETFQESFERLAATRSDRVVAVSSQGSMTYGELNERANRLAHHLLCLGLGLEEHVALLLEKGPDVLVAMLGVWKAGGAFLPLDMNSPPLRSARMLERADTRMILTQPDLLEKVAGISAAGANVKALTVDSDRDYPSSDPPRRARGHHLAYTIFTSGSTGEPKGVMVEHSGVPNMARISAEVYDLDPDSRFCQFLSITFDGALSEMLGTLISGAALYFGSREDLLPGPDLIRFVKRNRITALLVTPSVLAVLPVEDLPELQTLIVAGEACPPELLLRWRAVPRLVNAYGPTEITVFSHGAVVEPDGAPPPIGPPQANTRSYVLDPWLEPVPHNVKGELYIGSAGVARGYLDSPGLTAERFLPDPFGSEEGRRMYATGDIVRIRRDGQLEFAGRSDDQVKVRGFRIELREVEAALMGHPQVTEAAVAVAQEDGELVAYFTGSPDLGREELRAALATRVPSYMIPTVFTRLDAMPHTPGGKVDRRALPRPARSREVGPALAPRTPVERRVAGLWGAVLGLETVDTGEKFFESGGNSLRLVELWNEIDRVYPGTISVADLFEQTTVAAIASHIERAATSSERESSVAAYEL